MLFQIRYVPMFAALAKAAARRGILIMLACHRVKHDAWPGLGLWHDDGLGFPMSRVLDSWGRMATARGLGSLLAASLSLWCTP